MDHADGVERSLNCVGIGRLDDKLAQRQAVVGHGASRVAALAPVHQVGQRAAERQLAVRANTERPGAIAARQAHRRTEQVAARADGLGDVIAARDIAAKATAVAPALLERGLIVEAEPATMCGARGSGVDRDHFQEHVIAEAQQMVVRAHLRVRAALRRLHAQHIVHMGDAGGEARSNDGDVIKLGHLRA
jgi:hypothetical protein